jgi:FkbM family methyltransferase
MGHIGKAVVWDKYFIEPIPNIFAKLKENIKRWPRSHAVNIAIAKDLLSQESNVTMYCAKDDPLSKGWLNQICSFDKNHVIKHLLLLHKTPSQNLIMVNVTAMSFPTFLWQAGITNVDVLMIDDEGFDFHVMKQFPFHRIRPKVIVWEHKHLVGDLRQAAVAHAERLCYGVSIADHDNTFAVLQSAH